MKILIVSDIHYKLKLLDEVLEKEAPCDYILDLGDSIMSDEELESRHMISVKGNGDFNDCPIFRTLQIDGLPIFMTHGHKYAPTRDMNHLYFKTLEENCKICLFGHTHIPYLKTIRDITFINPGSLRDTRTYVVIENSSVDIRRINNEPIRANELTI